MRRDERLYDILRRLRDGQLHTAAQMAADLGVSVRTIWRDMADLAASGVPVAVEHYFAHATLIDLLKPRYKRGCASLRRGSRRDWCRYR